jgi:hypothetical protein
MNEEQFKYLTSERFIHDSLMWSSQQVVEAACDMWREGKKVENYAISWPSQTVRSDQGDPIDRAIIMEIPNKEEQRQALTALVARTSSYGLLLLEVDEKQIHAVFESGHGTRAWTIPIERHGDRLALGDQKVKDDTECIGLLWSKSQGKA